MSRQEAATAADAVTRLVSRRDAALSDLAAQAGVVAQACHDMAARFHQGGKLLVFGTGGRAPTPSTSRWSSCTRSSWASGHCPPSR